MDNLEFAKVMIEYGELLNRLQELEKLIKPWVLKMGKTQVVGNVRARYNNPRKSYDYMTAWEKYGIETGLDIQAYKQVSYDYRQACADGKIKEIPFSISGEPSVTISLEKEKSDDE